MIEAREIKDRAEWLKWRQDDLTASDIGAWIGKDRFKSPLGLYAEKTMRLPPQADNASMQRGRWLEAAVLSAYREKHPDHHIQQASEYLRDPDIRLGGTPDALIKDGRRGFVNAQCKVISRPVFEREWAKGIPLGYRLQTLTEGMLLDARASVLLALVIDTYTAELREYPVRRHAAAEARVRRIAVEFWDRVASGRKPPMDYARDADVVTAMFPASVPDTVLDLTGDNRLPALLLERGHIKQDIAEDERRVAAIDTEIKAKLGDAERAELPGWKLSWKTEERKEYTVAASTRRVLRITETDVEEEVAA